MDCDLTHPASAYGAQSQLTIHDFKRRLHEACDNSSSSTKPKKYNKVKVLLLHWQHDTNGEQQVERLRHYFQQGYGHECVIQPIPTVWMDHDRWLLHLFNRIMKETDKNDLIIFYYVGSAIKKDVSPYISRPCTLL